MNRRHIALNLTSRLALCLGVLAPLAAGCVADDPDIEDADRAGEQEDANATDAQPDDGRVEMSGAKFQRALVPVEGQYIIKLRADAQEPTRGRATRLTAAHRGEVLHVYDSVLRGFVARMPEEEAVRLAEDPDVELVEEDGVISVDAIQTNPTWGLDRIDKRVLSQNGKYVYDRTGAGVHAYIIDTGIRQTHAEFTGRIGAGYDAVTSGGSANDCHGHGTHVAGTVGGTTYGVAKGVTLHPVRVLDCTGSGTVSGVVAGMDWVKNNHASPAIANMSLGGGISSSIDDAVQNLVSSGVTVVVAAGNSSADACNTSPARAPNALTVGGGGDVVATVSILGPWETYKLSFPSW